MTNEPESVDVTASQTHTVDAGAAITPIVVDLGSKSKKAIKKLKEGRGKLMFEVSDAVERVRAKVGKENQSSMPVVIIYRQKASKKSSASSMLPLLPSPFSMFR
jgi:hypothetical protein